MELRKNPIQNLNFKQRLSNYYYKGWLSLAVLIVILINLVVILFNRFRNAGLVKELSLAPFNLNLNLEQSYKPLTTSFTIEMILLVILWFVLILYFVGWILRRGKIRLDALIVYTLIGLFISSILYLTFSQQVNAKAHQYTDHQVCVKDETCVVTSALETENHLVDLGKSVNETFFVIQTTVLAMVFFSILSLLQLMIDRVRKLIILYKQRKVSEVQHG